MSRTLSCLMGSGPAFSRCDWPSRGGLSTKIHALIDGRGRPLVLLVGDRAGRRRADVPAFDRPLENQSSGPEKATVPPGPCARGPTDQIGIGSDAFSPWQASGLYNKEDYKGRNLVERNFNIFKQWRGLAPRYDKTRSHLPRWSRPPGTHHLAGRFRRHALDDSTENRMPDHTWCSCNPLARTPA